MESGVNANSFSNRIKYSDADFFSIGMTLELSSPMADNISCPILRSLTSITPLWPSGLALLMPIQAIPAPQSRISMILKNLV